MKTSFASDNTAGVHPEVLQALEEHNNDYEHAYGYDSVSEQADAAIREHFGAQTQCFYVFGGTGANVISMRPFLHSYQAVICSDCSHIHTDECGAPEFNTGSKLLPIPHEGGKLTPEAVASLLHGFGVEHHAQPRIISITQSSEYGTVYTPDEISRLADLAHNHDMLLHVDGARLANAAASLDCSMKAITTDCGVDLVSFGGTKNGLMLGECVLILREVEPLHVKYIRKQSMQLAAKARYIAAQYLAYLRNDLWLRNARHANAMAKRLVEQIQDIETIRITQPVEGNHIFAILSPEHIPALQNEFPFYVWDETTHEVRWMTSFQTHPDDLDAFANTIRYTCS